jgi:hypothetical protein
MLHVANGHATSGLIELSTVAGRTMVWADPLDEGPVPGGLSDAELIQIRARFLASPDSQVNEVADDLAGWRAAIDGHDDELVLWFEHDLFDQLNLIQLLTHIGSRPRRQAISMVCINAFPGHTNFKGLGELTPEDLAGLFETRRPVTAEQLAVASRAWNAYRSPDPRALEALLETDTSPLPFLARAVRRRLEEFPADRDGLSRSERRLMEQARHGPADIHHAFPRMHDGEDAFYLTDTGFMDRANDLAAASPALLTLSMSANGGHGLPQGSFALTDAGRDVLRGAADRLRLCGIDRWLGGVHVNGRGPTWRWSAQAGRLVEA